MSHASLSARIAALVALPAGAPSPEDPLIVIEELLTALENGTIRAAERGADGVWRAVPWVKQGILIAFRFGAMADLSADSGAFSFVDKHTMPPRRFDVSDGVRIVPGGSTIRRGTYIAKGVVCMPPMFVNVGAWIGTGTMVDSHALVGSCAQIGERVHLSAAAQIGGVLEPVGASPVVIEDDVIVGGNCGVYEGTVVRTRAVIGAGVVLTRGTPVYDLVNETVYRATPDAPLEIPAGAVVVPGARAVRAPWAAEQGLSLQTPVIVKYRDERTDLATALEAWLR
ncbi:MAG: 2,3,4,5-tetrahydropyridine-2,6-dicarboxylate N-succinyltransferase [Gemmatimonadetes bacterium]|nr:2,3,4,5-tetrahydropyridine-2,6-dicarboxylate N-succinyltransferase [Gemmatimonadota bacterium]